MGGETLTLRQKADLLLAMTQAVSGAATAVEWMWSVAGTSGIFQASPLERYFRDMQVLKHHAFYSIQEKDFCENAPKPPGPMQSGDHRVQALLLVHWQT